MAVNNRLVLQNAAIAESLEETVALMEGALRAADTVLLGESTHGTLEFYLLRAALSKYLIERLGYEGIIWEADLGAIPRVDRYVRCIGNDPDATDALADFRRFPRWMWRNYTVADFIRWLRRFNEKQPPKVRVGVWGMDLFSLYASIDLVRGFLQNAAPEVFNRASRAYQRFDAYRQDPHQYGRAGAERWDGMADSLNRIVGEIGAVERSADSCVALQNACLIRAAEQYYREVYIDPHRAWNVRERFMMESISAVRQELERRGRGPKIIVWCHNSHAGDGREIEMSGRTREITLGQLCREDGEVKAVSVGFSSYSGEVLAASRWNGSALVQTLRPAKAGSWEHVFHSMRKPLVAMRFTDESAPPDWRAQARPWRSVGAVYKPDREWKNHYSLCRLFRQFDFMVHLDRTFAVEPLDAWDEVQPGEAQTFPSGV